MKIINKLKENYDKIIIYVPALSPIDLIPDFIPVLGYLDDFIIVPILIIISIKLIPKDLFEECILNAKNMNKNDNTKKWYFAIFIIISWLLFLFILFMILKNKRGWFNREVQHSSLSEQIKTD